MQIQSSHYGSLKRRSKSSYLFTLSNENNYSVSIINLGGIIVRLDAPDRFGTIEDIALGKASLADYEAGHPNFGALTGRVAGRISGAHFELAGKRYQLEANNGPNCLHGGTDGWEKQVWEPRILERRWHPKTTTQLPRSRRTQPLPWNDRLHGNLCPTRRQHTRHHLSGTDRCPHSLQPDQPRLFKLSG